MDARERLLEDGYENVKILINCSYDNALIGVSNDGRAVYDYEKMIECLMDKEVTVISLKLVLYFRQVES